MAGSLSVRKVETLKEPGRYSDGGNLYLFITPNGGKRWTFLYRLGGKRREMGLGSAGPHGVGLKQAREKAAEARRMVAAGMDPLEARAAEEKASRTIPTFGTFADDYIKSHKPKFRNEKHVAQWEMTLGDAYCRPIRAMPINEIDTEAVLSVLQPIWTRVPETASRLRGRIENVLDAARALGSGRGRTQPHGGATSRPSSPPARSSPEAIMPPCIMMNSRSSWSICGRGKRRQRWRWNSAS
jgi:hypothetical protein